MLILITFYIWILFIIIVIIIFMWNTVMEAAYDMLSRKGGCLFACIGMSLEVYSI